MSFQNVCTSSANKPHARNLANRSSVGSPKVTPLNGQKGVPAATHSQVVLNPERMTAPSAAASSAGILDSLGTTSKWPLIFTSGGKYGPLTKISRVFLPLL